MLKKIVEEIMLNLCCVNFIIGIVNKEYHHCYLAVGFIAIITLIKILEEIKNDR